MIIKHKTKKKKIFGNLGGGFFLVIKKKFARFGETETLHMLSLLI